MAQPFTIVGPTAVSVALIGCAAGPRGAELTVAQWVHAAERGDCMGMYGLLDATVTAALDAEEFLGWCELHRGQLEIHARHIEDSAASIPLRMQARLSVYGGRAVAMTIDPDSPSRWRLVDPLPFAVGADSPLELLAELSALVESGAMEHALSMMSESMRAEYLAELQLVATALANADEAVVTVDGHWAEVSLGDTVVELRRNNGAWQIESVDQVNYYGYYEGY